MKPTTAQFKERYAEGLRACIGGTSRRRGLADVFGNRRQNDQVSRRDIAIVHAAVCPSAILSAPKPTRRVYEVRAATFLLRALATRVPPAQASALKAEGSRRRAAERALRNSQRTQRGLLAEADLARQQIRRLAHKVIRAQEEERKEISRELHDEIVQTLASVNVQLATLKLEARSQGVEARRKISRTQRLVQKSVRTVYRFARELRPTLLDDLGLDAALRNFARDLQARSGIAMRVRIVGTLAGLSEDVCIVVYRVAQAALTNVAQHSGAREARMSIRHAAGALQIEISDDGAAFNVARVMRPHRHQRLGLIGMRERVEMLNGHFTVESARGHGTTVRATIPPPHRRAVAPRP